MDSAKIDLWASVLNQARITAKPLKQISLEVKDFARSEAYSIQERQLALRTGAKAAVRLAEPLGGGPVESHPENFSVKPIEKQIGWKMGLTSEAKRKQMDLDSPLYGFLTDQMQIASGGQYSLSGKIHPKIEPEIAFRFDKDLAGVVTREEVLAACDGVGACLEILDSRYEQFKYFSMEDVIADNSSSSEFVVGPWITDFSSLDLINLKMEMFADGQVSQTGVSSDISGDPVVSIIQLCAMLAERGQKLSAGSIVLAGAATLAIPLTPGLQVELRVENLPTVSVRVQVDTGVTPSHGVTTQPGAL